MHCRMHCMSAGICSTVVMSSDTVMIALLFSNNKQSMLSASKGYAHSHFCQQQSSTHGREGNRNSQGLRLMTSTVTWWYPTQN